MSSLQFWWHLIENGPLERYSLGAPTKLHTTQWVSVWPVHKKKKIIIWSCKISCLFPWFLISYEHEPALREVDIPFHELLSPPPPGKLAARTILGGSCAGANAPARIKKAKFDCCAPKKNKKTTRCLVIKQPTREFRVTPHPPPQACLYISKNAGAPCTTKSSNCWCTRSGNYGHCK
jgi:hypothetical protein